MIVIPNRGGVMRSAPVDPMVEKRSRNNVKIIEE